MTKKPHSTPVLYTKTLVVGVDRQDAIKVDLDDPSLVWHDIIGPVVPKASGAGSPTRRQYAGGNVYDWAFGAGDVCDFVFHIPHDYAAGTDLHIHVHWSHNGTSISGSAVFDFYAQYAKGHDQAEFSSEVNVSYTHATVDIATTPRYRHRVDEVQLSTSGGSATQLDTDDIEPDGVILGQLQMTTLPTISVGGHLFVHTVDVHYQSTNIGTKQKVPDFYAT